MFFMKNINKILYLIGVFSIVNILIWLYKNNFQNNEPVRWYVSGGFEKMSSDDIQDSIYVNGYMNDTLINDVKVASNIACVIIREHLKKDLNNSDEFKIYSVNKELWAIYRNDSDKLLLLMQKRDGKILYINSYE